MFNPLKTSIGKIEHWKNADNRTLDGAEMVTQMSNAKLTAPENKCKRVEHTIGSRFLARKGQ